MGDYIVRATAADHQIRAFAITSREMVEQARSIHNTSPVATAALGRLLTAGAMMGSMMKGDADLLTIGPGTLRVIKDLGLKEPYVGTVELQTGEIAEDLTYYFATSEQVPSSVGLGVLLNKDNTVRQAGGFIIQLMPFTDDKVIDALEAKLSTMDSVTKLLDQGMSPEQLLEYLLGDFGLEINDTIPASWYCNCSRERVAKAIVSIGSKDIREMIQDNKPIEVKCHFCNHAYKFDIEDLKEILKIAKR